MGESGIKAKGLGFKRRGHYLIVQQRGKKRTMVSPLFPAAAEGGRIALGAKEQNS